MRKYDFRRGLLTVDTMLEDVEAVKTEEQSLLATNSSISNIQREEYIQFCKLK